MQTFTITLSGKDADSQVVVNIQADSLDEALARFSYKQTPGDLLTVEAPQERPVGRAERQAAVMALIALDIERDSLAVAS